MAGGWKPGDCKDEFRARLSEVIQKRLKTKGVVKALSPEDALPANASTNVVDFMSLLQKSIANDKRTPAKKTIAKVVADASGADDQKQVAKKAATKKAKPSESAKDAAKKKAPAKKTA